MDNLETTQYISPVDEEEDVKLTENEISTDDERKDSTKQSKQQKQSHECDSCGKMFSFKSNLNRHIMSVHKEKSYTCDFCDRAFTRPEYLKSHSYSHMGVKPYKCTLCGKSYVEKRAFKLHTYTHTGEEAHYRCEVCGKGYFRKYLLNRHEYNKHGKGDKSTSYMYKYTGRRIRSDPCDVCQKTFCDSLTLKRHMQIHTGEKEVECYICKKQFCRQHTLNKHIFRKHNPDRNKITKCVHCNKVFKFSSGLEKHTLRYHKNNGSKKESIRAESEVTVQVNTEDNKVEIVDDQSQHILSTLENGEELVYVKMEASDSE